MSKTKIDNEIKETELKNKQIEAEVDTNETSEEAETIKDITFSIWNIEYKFTQLIELIEKNNRNYFEKELVKKFKLMMDNYYTGIIHAVFRACCNKRYTLEDLKKKLTDKDIYNIIEMRCSRKNIRFDKDTVDTVVYFAERYLNL